MDADTKIRGESAQYCCLYAGQPSVAIKVTIDIGMLTDAVALYIRTLA